MNSLMLFLLFPVALFAFPGRELGGYPDPIPGLLSVAEFCEQLDDDKEIIRCLRAESAANFFSENTLQICRAQTWDADRVSCILPLVNKVVSDAEVQLCQGESFDSEKAKCLASVQRNYPYRTTWKVSREPGASRATQFCAQFFSETDRRQCLQVTSSAQFYSEFAVQVCESFFSDWDKLSCIAQAKDRALLPVEARACLKLFADSDKKLCLTSVNRKWKLRP